MSADECENEYVIEYYVEGEAIQKRRLPLFFGYKIVNCLNKFWNNINI